MTDQILLEYLQQNQAYLKTILWKLDNQTTNTESKEFYDTSLNEIKEEYRVAISGLKTVWTKKSDKE